MPAHVSVVFFMQVEVVWCMGSTYQSPFPAAWVCDLTFKVIPKLETINSPTSCETPRSHASSKNIRRFPEIEENIENEVRSFVSEWRRLQ
ncbi:hypothetical protein EDB80DRAFT_696578 [Ilyonectria destructans]|nr:hypothetical protein EDB80DRAFT_696578 [Ilyonectria destructans]